MQRRKTCITGAQWAFMGREEQGGGKSNTYDLAETTKEQDLRSAFRARDKRECGGGDIHLVLNRGLLSLSTLNTFALVVDDDVEVSRVALVGSAVEGTLDDLALGDGHGFGRVKDGLLRTRRKIARSVSQAL